MNQIIKKKIYVYNLPAPICNLTTNYSLDLLNLVNNKNVILVGPSNYLLDMNLGDYIDNFSTVVRIKKGAPIPENMITDYGKKTDILYTNMRTDNNTNSLSNHDLKILKKNKLKCLCYPYPNNDLIDIRFKTNWLNNIKNINKYIPVLNTINHNDFILLQQYMKCRPTTGMLAIIDLLRYYPKKLQVIGFTFRTEWLDITKKKTNIYNMEYKNNQQLIHTIDTLNNIHSIEYEWEFFKYLLENVQQLNYHFNSLNQL